MMALVSVIWVGIELSTASEYVAIICYLLGHLAMIFNCVTLSTCVTNKHSKVGLIVLAFGVFTFIVGVIFQTLMSGKCAAVNAAEDFGCPLPDEFNHNAVFHLIQTVACFILFAGGVVNLRQNRVDLISTVQ